MIILLDSVTSNEASWMEYFCFQALTGNSMYEAVLVISETKNTHFQTYKLTVRNSINKRETTLTLSQGNPGECQCHSWICLLVGQVQSMQG